MLWRSRAVPAAPLPPPRSEKRERTLFFGSSQEKGVSGVCYFCCPIASTWVAQGWLFIMLPGQVARSYGGEMEGGGGERSTDHHRRDSVSTASVSRPPGSVKNHTLGRPWGGRDADSQLLISLSSSLSLSWPDVVFSFNLHFLF